MTQRTIENPPPVNLSNPRAIYLETLSVPIKQLRPWLNRYAIHPVTGKVIIEVKHWSQMLPTDIRK